MGISILRVVQEIAAPTGETVQILVEVQWIFPKNLGQLTWNVEDKEWHLFVPGSRRHELTGAQASYLLGGVYKKAQQLLDDRRAIEALGEQYRKQAERIGLKEGQ